MNRFSAGESYAADVEIERVQRPFWAHQLVEYLVGIALISVAVQQPQPAVPAILGLLVVLNAAVAKGPAGAFRLVGRRLHRLADLVLIALLVIGAIQPWASLDNVGRLALGGVAFVLFFVWFHTDFTERVPRAKRAASPTRARAASTERATGRDSNRDTNSDTGNVTSEDIGRGAGRLVGNGVNSLKRWKDSFTDGSAGADD